MTTLTAIETCYRGYRFRSRLEARWAVFLTEVNISWEYEAEGFDIGGTWYLPDFWLPRDHAFLEIKPRTDYDGRHHMLDTWKVAVEEIEA